MRNLKSYDLLSVIRNNFHEGCEICNTVNSLYEMGKFLKILYVDDETVNLRLFHSCYKRELDVSVTDSALEAIEILSNGNFDVLITDQKMPGMLGTELLIRVKALELKKPLFTVLLSGYRETEAVQEAFQALTLDKFVQKPWQEEDLRKVFNEAENIRSGE